MKKYFLAAFMLTSSVGSSVWSMGLDGPMVDYQGNFTCSRILTAGFFGFTNKYWDADLAIASLSETTTYRSRVDFMAYLLSFLLEHRLVHERMKGQTVEGRSVDQCILIAEAKKFTILFKGCGYRWGQHIAQQALNECTEQVEIRPGEQKIVASFEEKYGATIEKFPEKTRKKNYDEQH